MSNEQPETREAFLARKAALEVLQNDGIDVKICGQTLKMRAVPFCDVESMGERIQKFLAESVPNLKTPRDQYMAVRGEVRKFLADLFSMQPENKDITPDTFERVTEVDLRIVWETFLYLNVTTMTILGKVFGPIFQHLGSEIMGQLSAAVRIASEHSGLPSPLSQGPTDGQ